MVQAQRCNGVKGVKDVRGVKEVKSMKGVMNKRSDNVKKVVM